MTLPPKTRYPAYDVLAKRDTVSWDDATRAVIDERLATPSTPAFCDAAQWRAVTALCACIVPQRSEAPQIPVAALVDAKLAKNSGDGYRDARLPALQEAWRIGLAAVDEESRARFGLPFASIEEVSQIALLQAMERGELVSAAWQGMPSKLFFAERVLHDICSAYYSHPHAWSQIGFGGPANPRGYVRMGFDRRDPWEAVESREHGPEKRHAR
ncbi:gluconate 2-dehydrogenase (acceptor) [Caballeronia arationis]|uniref:gluconate 2-dehydrogenase subunit 3 family protein n=1 Tax=Caballeronia arationis TaxID=1777142 RepID=UPI00074C89BF|nr:gluconate 2-dehydrogenase subunit 3 family protein [Caballeronia arationis]SAL03307.1 gluconate 2-dehydrogenase (acceptor) [Caballeronia arationis]